MQGQNILTSNMTPRKKCYLSRLCLVRWQNVWEVSQERRKWTKSLLRTAASVLTSVDQVFTSCQATSMNWMSSNPAKRWVGAVVPMEFHHGTSKIDHGFRQWIKKWVLTHLQWLHYPLFSSNSFPIIFPMSLLLVNIKISNHFSW